MKMQCIAAFDCCLSIGKVLTVNVVLFMHMYGIPEHSSVRIKNIYDQ
jgi:hypothetical protein